MNRFWLWLDGKKTGIAAVYWTVAAYMVPIWFPSGLPGTWAKVNVTIGTLLTVLGLGHKAFKGMIGDKQAGGADVKTAGAGALFGAAILGAALLSGGVIETDKSVEVVKADSTIVISQAVVLKDIYATPQPALDSNSKPIYDTTYGAKLDGGKAVVETTITQRMLPPTLERVDTLVKQHPHIDLHPTTEFANGGIVYIVAAYQGPVEDSITEIVRAAYPIADVPTGQITKLTGIDVGFYNDVPAKR
jgi:hypothetical protein